MPSQLRAYKAGVFQALAHPTRIAIVEILRDGELSAGAMQAKLGIEQANLSQHLTILRSRQIVINRKHANQVFYSLSNPVLCEVLDIMRHYCQTNLYNALLLGLALVFTAANAFFFLSAWEVMAVSAFCLVTFEHEKAETRDAALVYIIMSHAGTAMLLAAFLLLAAFAGGTDFASFHLLASNLPPAELGAVFLLFFAGFGVKAGIVPLHVWLPDAHPLAPSNVSALMSGIVIKCGIYGMARVFFDFYGPPPLWTGTLVLGVGVVTAVVGVLYALQEHDLKRLLAYHSIENIGIIVMGFGAALMFRTLGYPNLAAIAIVGALYHTLNHAIFKGLLFLAAGSVVQSVRTRNMEEMGGLIRRMPGTAFFFLFGAIAISGLPPLNGFVSEWLTYQALLAGFGTTHSLTRLMFPIAGALLALTAALAAACFVKAFG